MAKSPDSFTCELGTFRLPCRPLQKSRHSCESRNCQVQANESGQLRCTTCGEVVEPINV